MRPCLRRNTKENVRKSKDSKDTPPPKNTPNKTERKREFHLDFLNPAQESAWKQYQKNDLIFLLGAAGSGKSHLATAFAVHDIMQNKFEKIVITRPVVEAGGSLGYLPGDFNDKILPYMMPIYDCMDRIVPFNDKEKIRQVVDVVPLNFMRGRTFNNSVFILDEAQNCTYDQLKLAVTRLGIGSKMIITGDPEQSDLYQGKTALEDFVAKISDLNCISVVRFKETDIVRHSLIAKILTRL